MSHSKRNKSHSKSSDRHINEPVQAVLHSLQRQRLGNCATNSPRSDELLENPQMFPEGGENSEILQWIESTVIKNSNPENKGMAQKEREASKEEAPVASTSKPQANQPPQEEKKKKKKKNN
ncbi:hypothetical protein O181_005845 [Austropuccinia psidii MF-1]|uniref:Uncharacterized protein n=1 Tax=Austropuccinia psidii MF-1 TaxID=1389203 RepID=A0A9Q3BJ63_9BASI|nr:hypothetical protein [Austropuccinia psidii MF-1]